jgi:hypothetical protein
MHSEPAPAEAARAASAAHAHTTSWPPGSKTANVTAASASTRSPASRETVRSFQDHAADRKAAGSENDKFFKHLCLQILRTQSQSKVRVDVPFINIKFTTLLELNMQETRNNVPRNFLSQNTAIKCCLKR